MHCLCFICERKFYARAHVKITRHCMEINPDAGKNYVKVEIHPNPSTRDKFSPYKRGLKVKRSIL